VLLFGLALAAAPPPVVGGAPAPEGAWPDAAAVYFRNAIGCTGVLIAPNLALTAGHCAGGITSIKVGAVDHTDPDAEEIDVRREIEYPDSQRSYDVTLLILEEESTIPPRTLALDCVLEDHLRDGAAVQIVGWGATNAAGTRYPDELYEATSEVSDADCSDPSLGCVRAVSPGGELAAGGDGVDSCYGDSGGPLYLQAGDDWYLVGITSRGVNGSTNCGAGGIYVRPDALVDWIEEESGQTLARPDCTPNLPPEPTADDVRVTEGDTATSQVRANDPDADDQHTYTLSEPPEFGTATVDGDGLVTYVADGGDGRTSLTVTVTDDGDPAEAEAVTLDVRVDPAADGRGDGGGGEGAKFALPGCGCTTPAGGPVGLGVMLGAAALLLRWRRAARSAG